MWLSQLKLERLTRHPVCQFAKNLKELIGLVLFWLIVAKSPFGKPALEVRYRLDRLYPPIAAQSCIEKQTENGQSAKPLSALVQSRDLLRLTIRNNSSETIGDVDLQVDAVSIADVAVHSTSSRVMADRTKVAVFEISETFIARFPNFTSIPPKARVEMLIWGDINRRVWDKPVQVFSSAETVEVVQEGRVSGMRLFIARNLLALTVFLAIGLLLLGLRRYARSRAE